MSDRYTESKRGSGGQACHSTSINASNAKLILRRSRSFQIRPLQNASSAGVLWSVFFLPRPFSLKARAGILRTTLVSLPGGTEGWGPKNPQKRNLLRASPATLKRVRRPNPRPQKSKLPLSLNKNCHRIVL